MTRAHVRAAEAAVALFVSQVLVRCLSVAAIARLTSATVRAVTVETPVTAHTGGIGVARALAAASARLPWRSTCLVQAIAGRLMLRRRGVASAVVLGVRRDEDTMDAHAWLTADGGIVCGGEEAGRYRPLAVLDENR